MATSTPWLSAWFGALTSTAVVAPDEGGSTAPQPSSNRPAAVDAAFGTPPAGAGVDPTTTDNAGFAERSRGASGDQVYRSSARGVGADGTVNDGYQILDADIGGYDDGPIEQIPPVHVVQSGETLWGISNQYLGDPYAWPRVWSYNEQITNPHWIFPGDRVHLVDPRQGAELGQGQDAGPGLQLARSRLSHERLPESYLLNQVAYVDAAEFESSMRVVGGGDANVMMATFDTVYLSYSKDQPPVPGERLMVYAPQEKVKAIKGKKVLGYIVQVMGEVQIQSVSRKAAEGTVALAHNPIERGYRVGPLRRQFRRIERSPASHTAGGLVVATMNDAGPIPIKGHPRKSLLGEHVLVGENQFVVVDVGREDGAEVGNVLDVVRKGDEYTKKRVFATPYEDGWPRRVVGALLIVEVQDETSLCVAIDTQREVERGDHVELRPPGFDGEVAGAPSKADEKSRRGGAKASGRGTVHLGG